MAKIKITEEQANMLKEMGKTKVLKVTQEQYNKILEMENYISEKNLSSMGKAMVKQANPMDRSQMTIELKKNLPEMYEKFINELYGVSESTEKVYEKLHKLMEGAGLINNGKLVKEKFDGDKKRVKQVINAGLYEMACGGSAYKAMEAIEEALDLSKPKEDNKLYKELVDQWFEKHFNQTVDNEYKKGNFKLAYKLTKRVPKDQANIAKRQRDMFQSKDTERQKALKALANRENEDRIEEDETSVAERVNLKDLTFDQVKDSFPNFYQKPIDIDRDPSDEYYSYSDAINFPNPEDSLTTISNRGVFNYWKNNTIEMYGDVELEFNPEAVWSRRVKIIDDKFKQDKEQYIKTKAKSDSGGLDELEMEEASTTGSVGGDFVSGVSLGGEPKYKPEVKIVPEEEIDGAEHDPPAPWNQIYPDYIEGKEVEGNYEVIGYNTKAAILKDKKGNLFVFHYHNMDDSKLEPYADVEKKYVGKDEDGNPVYDYGDEFNINKDAISSYVNDFEPGVSEKESGRTSDLDEQGITSVGTYDTPGFASSKFMGTKGKKGKAPVNKGITHKKTMRPDYKFVTIKDKCNEFPYCDQGPDAISINESLYEEIAKKTNRTVEDVKKIINNKNK